MPKKATNGQAELLPPGEATTTELTAPPASNPAELLRLAVEQNADLEKLEKLMDLQERYEAGQARRAYFAAFADLQAAIPEIIKTREVHRANGDLLYKFASLDQIVAVVRPVAKEHGFTHRFNFAPAESSAITVTCIVTHRAGHSETTTVTVPPTTGNNTNAAQNAGIMQQYGMRYAYCGAFGIATANEDADGITPGDVATVNAAELATLKGLCKKAGKAHTAALLKWAKADDLAGVEKRFFAAACKTLNKHIAGANGETPPY